ncbi:hypothetical protein [Streptomyces sp. MMBL 11-3]|uniref:hypothetical protein n=1 Tax=Streptomyces sp. MMBL 11-3 TaxID=3382639 RepID=UPI0039B3E2C2
MSGYDERARHDEHGRHGDDDEHEQHAGNETVNHGPSENPGPEETGRPDTTDTPARKAPDTADTAGGTAPDAEDRPSAASGPADSADSPGSPDASGAGAPTEITGRKPSGAAGRTPRWASRATAANGTSGDGTSGDGEPGTGSAAPKPEGTDASGAEASGANGAGGLRAGAGAGGLGAVGAGVDGAAADGGGADGSGADGSGPADLFGSDELALRRLLHQAVEEIEPSDGTLDHLRRAVPARRARKRQAVVGMAAAALFIGTAVPALVHVSNSSGSDADPSMAGAASATQGGGNEGKHSSEGNGSGDSSGSSKGSGKDGKKDGGDKGKGGDGSTAGTRPTTPPAGVPGCTPTQLVAVGNGVGAPDGAGAAYGSFTVTNVSGASCTVTGSGSVFSSALGAADQSKVGTMLHAAGDPAAGLPDPASYASALVLAPSASYQVKFAWVPSETCPAGGGNGGGEPSPDPTPTPDPTSGDSGGTSSEGTTGVDTQLMKADGTLDGSVSVTYTAEGGAPATSTIVPNACAGTVYRTGVLSGA